MTTASDISIARIVRVNHAGEYGAIQIYGAQILVSSFLWKSLVAPLSELRSHEIAHCKLFKDAMPARGSRPCRTMWLWSKGGWFLGFVTALLGPKAIWICTEVVEDNVHHHLADQLHYLDGKDPELFDLIQSIQAEEEGHLHLARQNKGAENFVSRSLSFKISMSVDAVIWLSTWGDSARMRRDLKQALR